MIFQSCFQLTCNNDRHQGRACSIAKTCNSSTQQNLPTPQNLQVTVVKVKGKYLLSQVQSIQVSS